MKVKDFYFSKSDAGIEIRKSPHIGVYHTGAARWTGKDADKILLTGWQFDAPVKPIGEKKYRVALSDHPDFNQLLEYISYNGIHTQNFIPVVSGCKSEQLCIGVIGK